MSDLNGFRKYESALINGMLASGKYTLEDIEKNFSTIRLTARKFSGSVDFPLYPIGANFLETSAAQDCLYAYLETPKPLNVAINHLLSLGFDERIARYTYNFLMSGEANRYGKPKIALWEVDGVALLMREDYWKKHIAGGKQ